MTILAGLVFFSAVWAMQDRGNIKQAEYSAASSAASRCCYYWAHSSSEAEAK
jgi:hypothetical protein